MPQLTTAVAHNCFCSVIDSQIMARFTDMRLTGSFQIKVEEAIKVQLPLKSDCECHPVNKPVKVPVQKVQAPPKPVGAVGGGFKQTTMLEIWADGLEELVRSAGMDNKQTFMKLYLDSVVAYEGKPHSEVMVGGVEHEKWRCSVENDPFNKARKIRAEFLAGSANGRMIAYLEESGEAFRRNGGFTSKLRVTDSRVATGSSVRR